MHKKAFSIFFLSALLIASGSMAAAPGKATVPVKTAAPVPEQQSASNAVPDQDPAARKAGRHGVKITARKRVTHQSSITYMDQVQALLPVKRKGKTAEASAPMRLVCNHMNVSLFPDTGKKSGGSKKIREIVCTQSVHLFDGEGYDVTADKITFYFYEDAPETKPGENGNQLSQIVGEGKVHMIDAKTKRELSGEKLTLFIRPGNDQDVSKVIGEKDVHLEDPRSGKEIFCDQLTLHFREGGKQEIQQADGVGHVKLFDKKEKSRFASDKLTLFFQPATAADKGHKNVFQLGKNKLERAEGVGNCFFVMPGLTISGSQKKKVSRQRPDTQIQADRSIIDLKENTFEFQGGVRVDESQNDDQMSENSVLCCEKMTLFARPIVRKKPAAPGAEAEDGDENALILDDETVKPLDGSAPAKGSRDSAPGEIKIGNDLELTKVICDEKVLLVRRTEKKVAPKSLKKRQDDGDKPTPPEAESTFEAAAGSHAVYTVEEKVIVISGGSDDFRPWMMSLNPKLPPLAQEADRINVNLETRAITGDGNVENLKVDGPELKKRNEMLRQLLNSIKK